MLAPSGSKTTKPTKDMLSDSIFTASESATIMLSQNSDYFPGTNLDSMDFDIFQGIANLAEQEFALNDLPESPEGRVDSDTSEFSASMFGGNADQCDDHNYDERKESVKTEEIENEDSEGETPVAVSSPLTVPTRPKRAAASTKKRYLSYTSSAGSVELDLPAPRASKAAKKRKASFDEDDEDDSSKYGDKCMSKNAIAARENRQKKKNFYKDLEKNNEVLSKDNASLKQQVTGLSRNNLELQDEVNYLRGCLANAPEISKLIRRVQETPGIKNISTSLGTRKSKVQDENAGSSLQSAALSRARATRFGGKHDATSSPGICFHVNNGNASLEFCKACNKAASARSGKI